MRSILLSTLIYLVTYSAQSQKIHYEVLFSNAVHHEATISIIASGIKSGPAIFRMSRSSPGRYATHEFGKNIYDVKAFDQAGKAITVNRTDGDMYEVPRHSGYIKVSYTLFANYGDGTYSGIDPLSIHFNMPGTFMWIKGYDNAPIEIHFEVPKGNAGVVATQLKPGRDAYSFTAPGLQYFMDSPTKIGDIIFKEWDEKNKNGKNIHFRIAYEVSAAIEKLDEYTEKVKKVVREEKAVFTEFPDYDYGSYTFLASINPYVYGDGMEHRNSTMISSSAVFTGDNGIGVFAHEYFHCWNVERIRPKTIEPFNFEKSNMSNELWLAEGFTQYYGQLIPIRAGISNEESALGIITGAVRTKLNTPGGMYYSPIDASRHAVFVDAGTSIDKTNYPNMFVSYYSYGNAIALALDLELRINYKKTLDNFMQALWIRFGKKEVPYTVETVMDELMKLTSSAFGKQFFDKYIYGHEAIAYPKLLQAAGFQVSQDKSAPWIGNVAYKVSDRGLELTTGTTKGSPLYDAGIDADDIVTKADNKDVKSAADLAEIITSHKIGDEVPLNFLHRGKEQTTILKIAFSPLYKVIPYENAGLTLTDEMKTFRANWLGSQVK